MTGVEVTAAMVTAAAEAIEDEAIRRIGRDLGTLHRDDIVRAGLVAALEEQAREAARLAELRRPVRAAPVPDIPVPYCPQCGDPVITSGCYPGDGVCGGEVDDVPPNAGSAS